MAHIRVDLTFPREEKLKQLARDLDLPIVYAAAHVNWLWLAVMEKPENRFDGNMDGWTPEVIADFAGYTGDPKKFLKALIDCGRPKKKGLVEDRNGILFLHEWKKWQGPLLNKMEADRETRLEAARAREERKSTKRPPSAGDDTVEKTLLDAMRASNITGPPAVKREHIAAWRTRKVTEDALSIIMNEGKGQSIFWISNRLSGNHKQDAVEDSAAAIRKKFLGSESK